MTEILEQGALAQVVPEGRRRADRRLLDGRLAARRQERQGGDEPVHSGQVPGPPDPRRSTRGSSSTATTPPRSTTARSTSQGSPFAPADDRGRGARHGLLADARRSSPDTNIDRRTRARRAARTASPAAARRCAARPRPRSRRCSDWPRRSSASRPAQLSVSKGVVSGGGKSVTYGSLSATSSSTRRSPRRSGHRAGRRHVEAAGPVHARRQAAAAPRHPGEGRSARTPTSTTSACRGCSTAASSARAARPPTARASRRSVDESLDQAPPRRADRPQGRLPRRRRAARVRSRSRPRRSSRSSGSEPPWTCPATATSSAALRRREDDRLDARRHRATSRAGFARRGARCSRRRYTVAVARAGLDRPARRGRRRDSKDSAFVFAATQNIYGLRSTLAVDARACPSTSIRVQYYEGSSNYGNSPWDDTAHAAAILSQQTGKPVRLQFMRWDEHGWDAGRRRAAVRRARPASTRRGTIVAYEFASFQPEWVISVASAELAGTATGAASALLLQLHREPDERRRQLRDREPPRAQQGRLGQERLAAELVHAGSGRELGAVRERADDRRARARGHDGPARVPQAEHRRDAAWIARARRGREGRRTGRPRRRGVEPRRAPTSSRGRGIAIGGYVGTRAAVVADIEVNKKTGKITRQAPLRRAGLRPRRQPGVGREPDASAA